MSSFEGMEIRGSSRLSISDSRIGLLRSTRPLFRLSFLLTEIFSSANVFHSPHEGHFPNHFGDSYPQFEQKNTDLVFTAITYFNCCLRNIAKVIPVAIATLRDSACSDGLYGGIVRGFEMSWRISGLNPEPSLPIIINPEEGRGAL